MKPKFNQKLVLNKKTIADLGREAKRKVYAGYVTHTCGYGGASCPGDNTCDGGYTCGAGCTQTCGCPQPTDDCTRKFQETCFFCTIV